MGKTKIKRYPKVSCPKCKFKDKLPCFVSGMGTILVCPKCGRNFRPRRERRKVGWGI